jgi:hypothetical protein
MKYRSILYIHLASLGEAIVFKFLIDYELVVCVMPHLTSFYSIIAMLTVKNMLILGGYQMYFWPQKNHLQHRRKYLKPTALDKWIPALPYFFWIYTPLYYVFFSLAILCLPSFDTSAMHAWLMLMHSSFWFVYFPTSMPKEFRESIRRIKTDRFTKYITELVYAHDSEENACPSMHCAFAIFLACITFPYYPFLSIIFPILVALSCLFTKQHLLIDIIPGVLLGFLHGLMSVMIKYP